MIALAELIISELPTIWKKYIAMPPFSAGRNERPVHGIAPLAACTPDARHHMQYRTQCSAIILMPDHYLLGLLLSEKLLSPGTSSPPRPLFLPLPAPSLLSRSSLRSAPSRSRYGASSLTDLLVSLGAALSRESRSAPPTTRAFVSGCAAPPRMSRSGGPS